MSARSMSAGITPSATINMAPTSGENGQGLCYNSTSAQYSPAVATGAGTYVTGGTLTFAPSAGGGTFAAGAFSYTKTLVGDGAQWLIHLDFVGCASTANLDATPATLDAVLPAGLSAIGGGFCGVTQVTDSGAAKMAAVNVGGFTLRLYTIGGVWANGAATISPFRVTYLSNA